MLDELEVNVANSEGVGELDVGENVKTVVRRRLSALGRGYHVVL